MNKQRIIYGTMGLGDRQSPAQLTGAEMDLGRKALEAALASGIDFFDTADIYQNGKSEAVLGQFLKEHPGLRKDLTLQSKVGIQTTGTDFGARYNFSYDHITTQIKKILERLGTDYLDILLLHRPDPLLERDELYRAIDQLFSERLIKALGVSNMNRDQIELIRLYTGRRVVANQLELSLHKHQFVSSFVGFNNPGGAGTDFPIGTLEYCMLNDITLQAWSPLAKGLYTGRPLTDPVSPEITHTQETVARMARELHVAPEAVVLAWVMRHPARIEPVIGTTDPLRIRNCMQAREVELSRDQWYELLVSARGERMP
ncbi:MAG: aldo/keto reductase [Spirochaetota bacterium]